MLKTKGKPQEAMECGGEQAGGREGCQHAWQLLRCQKSKTWTRRRRWIRGSALLPCTTMFYMPATSPWTQSWEMNGDWEGFIISECVCNSIASPTPASEWRANAYPKPKQNFSASGDITWKAYLLKPRASWQVLGSCLHMNILWDLKRRREECGQSQLATLT